MGAIDTEPFVPRPIDQPVRRTLKKLYREWVLLGIAPPPQSDDAVTRAELVDFIKLRLGTLLNAELANDPVSMGYAGKTDQEQADLVNAPFVLQNRRIFEIPVLRVSVAPASVTSPFTVVRNSNSSAIDFGALVGNNMVGLAMSFAANTPTVALRNHFAVIGSAGVNTLTPTTPLPAVPAAGPDGVGDRLNIVHASPQIIASRLHQIWRREPYAPNVVTAADIAAAKL